MISMNEIHLIKDLAPPNYAPHRYHPFAVNIRKMRKDLGFNIAAMATYFGVKHTTYQHWEEGRRLPHVSAMRTAELLELIRKHAPKLHKTLTLLALEHGDYDSKL